MTTTPSIPPSSTTGNFAAASTTGNFAAASTTGYSAAASTTGYSAAASTTGDRAAASTTGNSAAASTTGNSAAASTTGNFAAAIAVSETGWARAGAGGTIVLSHRDDTRTRILVAYPGETDGIEPGIWHHVVDGVITPDVDMLVPDDGRGYTLRHADGRYLAGCRNFTATEALTHWSDPTHYQPASAAVLLQAVKDHIARTEATA